MSDFTLKDLADIIAARARAEAGASYTKSLLDKGVPHVARKFGEEAVELIVAALERESSETKSLAPIVTEAADVLYHLLVLLQASGVSLADVLAELERRTGQSGHAEKASRAKPSAGGIGLDNTGA